MIRRCAVALLVAAALLAAYLLLWPVGFEAGRFEAAPPPEPVGPYAPNRALRSVEVYVDSLPGMPDNIRSNGRDTFWLALWQPRNPAQEWWQSRSYLRKVLARPPRSWIPVTAPGRFRYVVALGLDGHPILSLQDPDGDVTCYVTSATEHDGSLWLGTFIHQDLKRLPIPSMPDLGG